MDLHHFDPYSPELTPDPYGVYADMRREPGLVRSEELGGFYVACRHAEVHEGLRRTDIFSAGNNNVPVTYDPAGPPIPTQVDPPEHDAMRQPLARVFGPTHVALMEDFDRAAAAKRLDELSRRGGFEFVYDFAVPYVARFPRTTPLLGPNVAALRLRMSSERGAVELMWNSR